MLRAEQAGCQAGSKTLEWKKSAKPEKEQVAALSPVVLRDPKTHLEPLCTKTCYMEATAKPLAAALPGASSPSLCGRGFFLSRQRGQEAALLSHPSSAVNGGISIVMRCHKMQMNDI